MRAGEPGVGAPGAAEETEAGAPVEFPLTPEMAAALAPTGAKAIGWGVLQWASIAALALVALLSIYQIPHGGIVVALFILISVGCFPAFGAWWGRRARQRMAADVASGVFLRAEGPVAASGGQEDNSPFDSNNSQTHYEGKLTVGQVRLEHRNEKITKAAAQLAAGAIDYAKVTKTILELRDEQGAVVYRHARLPR